MDRYLALLRGINVGGKRLIKMSALQAALTAAGLADVETYIQSGNVLFRSDPADTGELADSISAIVAREFALGVEAVVFTVAEWRDVVRAAPAWWGMDDAWKHNLLVLLGRLDPADAVREIGALKPDIEKVAPGHRVVYQSMSKAMFGRTTTGKLAANPIYGKMTVRNRNTAAKLAELLAP